MTSESSAPHTLPHWVDNEPWEGSAARSGEVVDPATGRRRLHVRLADSADVDAIVEAARSAFPGWRDTSLARRTQVLFRFRELLAERKGELAEIITAEHGKVLDDALGEISRGLEVVEFACGLGHLLKGDMTDNASTGVDVHSLRQPLGPVTVVSPFNFPAMVPLWFFPLAIAAGNTVVLKPSEKDPSAANWLAELWAEAGLPPGVFNVLHGEGDAVDGLLRHSAVKAVSFVGSTPIARHVYETATARGKRVQALGGAKNHMLVLPDADLDQAAEAAVNAGFGSAGERCMAVSALVAIDSVADELVARVREKVGGIRVGDGRRGTDMGPLVTGEHRDRVADYVRAGVAEGAELLVDGREVTPEASGEGFWLGPTLFDHVTPEMSVYTDELFGPVLSVLRVSSYEEALELINANPYGNGVALFTNDGRTARHFQREVEVGMVGINVPIPVPVAYYSFGGWKASLFGDTHAYGTEGVHFFTRGKAVTTRWPEPEQQRVDLGFPQNT